jgi:hypothetical protein
MITNRLHLSALLACLAPVLPLHAQFSYTTPEATYTQNFNSLATSGTSWTNNSTLSGWFLTTNVTSGSGPVFSSPAGFTSAVVATALTVSNGSNTAGFHSLGSNSNADRALGGLPGSSIGGLLMGVQIKNDTGSTLNAVSVAYVGEQWRRAANATQVTNTLYVSYSTDATSLSTGTWTRVEDLDFVSPDATTTTAAGDLGGTARTSRSTSISSLAIADGDNVWFRFWSPNMASAEHILAVDDFTFSATAVPEPSAFAALAGLLTLGFVATRRRSRS